MLLFLDLTSFLSNQTRNTCKILRVESYIEKKRTNKSLARYKKSMRWLSIIER